MIFIVLQLPIEYDIKIVVAAIINVNFNFALYINLIIHINFFLGSIIVFKAFLIISLPSLFLKYIKLIVLDIATC